MHKRNVLSRGFTIVEVIIVVVVIAILAAVSIVGYNGIQQNARDNSLLSDIDKVEAELARYATKNNGVYGTALNWDSSTGGNSNISFTPSSGNIVTVRVLDDGYCIKAYNPASNANTLTNAKKKGVGEVGCSTGWRQQALGAASCALAVNGSVYCWGINTFGGLGNGSTSSSSIPTAVLSSGVLAGKTIKSVDYGGGFACAIASDSNVYCWGRGVNGTLGNGSFSDSSAPVAVLISGVLAGKTVKQIAAGNDHVCAIASDSNAYCWGLGSAGALGSGSSAYANSPISVVTSGALAGKTIKDIKVSANSTCSIASDDNLYCWGSRPGNGSTSSNAPVAVTTTGALAGKTIKNLSMGYDHVCAIASDDNAYCWGAGGDGRLGNGFTSSSNAPVAVTTTGALAGKTVKKLVSGYGRSCVVASDDNAYCWGLGTYGRLGNGFTSSSNAPVAVTTTGALAGKTIKDIVLGDEHTCAIASDNNAYCWGSGTHGRLGHGSDSFSTTPVAVTTSGALAGKTMKRMLAGSTRTCAIASDDNMYCWGYGGSGELGNGNTANSNVPVLVTLPAGL